MNEILAIKNLNVSYSNCTVLKELNLCIPNNIVVGLIGANGAGKTTLMKSVLSLIKKDSGEILYKDKDISNNYNNIGFMIEPRYNSHMNLYKNLESLLILHGFQKKQDRKKRIEDILKFVNLQEVKKKKISKFSYGMKQRYNLSCALINNPQILFLDEPMIGLDISGVEIFKKKIIETSKKSGNLIIISSHNLSDIEQICSRIIFLKNGDIIDNKDINSVVSKVHVIEFKEKIDGIHNNINSIADKIWLSEDKKKLYLKDISNNGINVIINEYNAYEILNINVQIDGLEEYYNEIK